jgi:hypothetical protein
MEKLGETKIENNQTGFKLATSVGGRGTGERGDRVILDDTHNVIKMESQMEREKTVRFFRESMSNRLNDDNSAIVIIMQRLHEGSASSASSASMPSKMVVLICFHLSFLAASKRCRPATSR